MNKKILVVDDSSLIRKHIVRLLESNEYDCDVAKNGQEAVDMAVNGGYDAITMDINMPVMGGLEAIEIIMKEDPTPILVISSLTTEGASETFDALDLGALDYVSKPGQYRLDTDESGDEILTKLKAATRVNKRRLRTNLQSKDEIVTKKQRLQSSEDKTDIFAGANIDELESKSTDVTKIVLVGSSTGGPGLIEKICTSLPQNFPHPVCVVQHMPEQFTASFASRINSLSKVIVKESEHDEELRNGVVYIAKGGTHLQFRKKASGKKVIKHGTSLKTRFFTPSVDEMYLSANELFSASDINAILLTGIGDDGAEGMVEIHKKGGYTIGENEESCTVYGMPRVAFEKGGISQQMTFMQILAHITTISD
jgi:two-component system chemotaxis response regulator CheB